MDREDETICVAFACQRGGNHTAFTAGVLKTLLKDKKTKYKVTGPERHLRRCSTGGHSSLAKEVLIQRRTRGCY